MANWVTSKMGFPKNVTSLVDNMPVNMDLVESFEKCAGNSIKFNFQNNEPIDWVFVDVATRDVAYNEILSKICFH